MSLTKDRERELIRRFQQYGDQDAWQELWEAHEGLIRWQARSFAGKFSGSVEEEDLYQQGAIGFLNAIRSFKEEEYSNRLWTYAQYKVRGKMIAFLSEQLHLSEDARKQYGKILRIWDWLARKGQQNPTDEKVAEAAGLDLKVVQEVTQSWTRREVPLVNDKDDVVSTLPKLEEQVDLPLTVRQRFGPQIGLKRLVLFVPHDKAGYKWGEIVEFFTDRPKFFARQWKDFCKDLPSAWEIPHDWSVIWQLFQTPPPALTEQALRKSDSRGLRVLGRE